VLIQLDQADKANEKNMIIGEERSTGSEKVTKVSTEKPLQSTLKTSTLGGQDRRKGASSACGLTSHPRNSNRRSLCKNKVRPGFKELLTKYNKKGVTQKPQCKIIIKTLRANRFLLIKVQVLHHTHSLDRLLHGFGRILVISHLWIIEECICNHMSSNILLHIQIVIHYKDQLLLIII